MQILVVDDSPLCRDLMAAVLVNQGYTVNCAGDGVEALKVVDPMPDLIILDGRMPNMDGFDFLTRLRQSDQGQRTPVIFLTAVDDRALVFRASRLGVSEYILKSNFNLDELLRRVKKHLPAKRELAMEPVVVVAGEEAVSVETAGEGAIDGEFAAPV